MVLDENADLSSKYYIVTMNIQELIDEFQHKRIVIPRSYSRANTWTMREELIDPIVKGFKIPSVLLFREFDPITQREVKFIDDEQCQLRTIYSFVTGFPISSWNTDGTAPIPSEGHKPDPKYETTYKGCKFMDLPDRCKSAILGRQISTTIVCNVSDAQRCDILARYNNL